MTNIVHNKEMNEADHFALVMKQAEMLANAQIIPASYRRKPADIVAAGLAGRMYGWDVMAAMRNFHVIEGTASMRPEAMLGLVRQQGHSVTFEVNEQRAVAIGKRCDTGDEHQAEFSLKDAEAAGLIGKRNWKQYTESMLTWRAVSKLCRILFPDVVLGAGYVPEELGAGNVSKDGDLIEVDLDILQAEDDPGSNVIALSSSRNPDLSKEVEHNELQDRLSDLKKAVDSLSDVDKSLLKEWWKAEKIPALSSTELKHEDIDYILERIEWLEG